MGRSGFRHFLRNPGQLALSILGVTLGVAVFVAMDLGIQSAREAFRVSSRTVVGEATHQLVGSGAGVPDSIVAFLRGPGRIQAVAPVVEGFVSSPLLPDRPLRVVGLDPLSEGPFRPFLLGEAGGGLAVAGLLLDRGATLISRSTSELAGVEEGEFLPVRSSWTESRLRVVGILEPGDEWSRRGLRDLLVVDVAEAQDLLARGGRLDRVDLILRSDSVGRAQLSALADRLPPDLRIEPIGVREATMEEMIRAFDLNLTALSLLALLFGGFLIYNTMTFSVLQRRRTLGMLRALGATRRAVTLAILRDAALLGATGSILGLLLGIILGRGLVQLVTRTINDLYFVVSVEALSLPPGVLLKGIALGLGASLLAALPSAGEAGRVSPREALARSSLEGRARRLVPRAGAGGGGLAAVGGGLLLFPGEGLLLPFAGLFCVVVGMALFAPLATVASMRILRPLLMRAGGTLGAMAAQGVTHSLSRTAPAVAALVVAVSVTVGLGVMIGSFRSSVVDWLDVTLQADLYLSSASITPGPGQGRLPPELTAAAASLPGVAGISTTRTLDLGGEFPGARLLAIDLDPRGEGGFDFVEVGEQEIFPTFRAGKGVLVSEPFAYRYRLQPGDSLTLRGEEGTVGFPILAVYRDYGTEAGSVTLSRLAFDAHWSDSQVGSMAVFLEPQANEEEVESLLRAAAGPGALITIRSNRALRELSLEVFDRTFAITHALRVLAFLVAFVAVLSALMALQLERARELGVLRTVGLTPRQGWVLMTGQCGLLGGVAGMLAIPVGLVLAAIMIFVVNRRSFGWSVEMVVGLEHPAYGVLLALAGALVAGILPAWRSFRISPARNLRSE